MLKYNIKIDKTQHGDSINFDEFGVSDDLSFVSGLTSCDYGIVDGSHLDVATDFIEDEREMVVSAEDITRIGEIIYNKEYEIENASDGKNTIQYITLDNGEKKILTNSAVTFTVRHDIFYDKSGNCSCVNMIPSDYTGISAETFSFADGTLTIGGKSGNTEYSVYYGGKEYEVFKDGTGYRTEVVVNTILGYASYDAVSGDIIVFDLSPFSCKENKYSVPITGASVAIEGKDYPINKSLFGEVFSGYSINNVSLSSITENNGYFLINDEKIYKQKNKYVVEEQTYAALNEKTIKIPTTAYVEDNKVVLYGETFYIYKNENYLSELEENRIIPECNFKWWNKFSDKNEKNVEYFRDIEVKTKFYLYSEGKNNYKIGYATPCDAFPYITYEGVDTELDYYGYSGITSDKETYYYNKYSIFYGNSNHDILLDGNEITEKLESGCSVTIVGDSETHYDLKINWKPTDTGKQIMISSEDEEIGYDINELLAYPISGTQSQIPIAYDSVSAECVPYVDEIFYPLSGDSIAYISFGEKSFDGTYEREYELNFDSIYYDKDSKTYDIKNGKEGKYFENKEKNYFNSGMTNYDGTIKSYYVDDDGKEEWISITVKDNIITARNQYSILANTTADSESINVFFRNYVNIDGQKVPIIEDYYITNSVETYVIENNEIILSSYTINSISGLEEGLKGDPKSTYGISGNNGVFEILNDYPIVTSNDGTYDKILVKGKYSSDGNNVYVNYKERVKRATAYVDNTRPYRLSINEFIGKGTVRCSISLKRNYNDSDYEILNQSSISELNLNYGNYIFSSEDHIFGYKRPEVATMISNNSINPISGDSYDYSYVTKDSIYIYRKMEYVSIFLPIDAELGCNMSQENDILSYYNDKIVGDYSGEIGDVEKDIYYPVKCDDTKNTDISNINFDLYFRTRDLNDSKWNVIESVDEDSANTDCNWFIYDKYEKVSKKDTGVVGGDLLYFLGFTDEDVFYQKSKIGKSFLRLSFYDSMDYNKQSLLCTSTIFMNESEAFKKYITYQTSGSTIFKSMKSSSISPYIGVDTELYEEKKEEKKIILSSGDTRIGCHFEIKDPLNTEDSSEGYYLYVYKQYNSGLTEGTVYMKAEFNHAGYGKTVQFMLPRDEKSGTILDITGFTDGYEISELSKQMYIPIKVKYNKDRSRYEYRCDLVKDMNFSLYEIKIKNEY